VAHFAGAGRYFYLLKGGHSIGGEHAAIKGSSEEETIESIDLKIIGIMSPLRKTDTFYTILQSLLKEDYEQSQMGMFM
jgi:hypothetical protein